MASRAAPELAAKLRLPAGTEPILYRAGGCEKCGGSGFAGRTTIVEVLVMTERLRELVMKRAPADDILKAAEAEGMTTMYGHGVRKCLAGLTTLDEVIRVTTNL